MKALSLAALAALLLLPARAQDAAPAPVMREVRPGVYELGRIRLDRAANTVSFPAAVNKADARDLLEYVLVTRHGPTHESLLVTEVQPADLHFAMLLLGAKGSDDTGIAPAGGQIDAAYLKHAPKLKGDAVEIFVRWKSDDGLEKTAPVEQWLLHTGTKKMPAPGPWTYNGSILVEGRFLAQTEGSLAALVVNPGALLNNPRKGNDDDRAWAVNAKTVPPLDTPLEVVLKLAAPVPQSPTTK